MRKETDKPNAFAALRMLCALVVVYEHLAGVTGLSFPRLPDGRAVEIAVDIFFILSGYWITKSLEESSSIGVYFKKRARHILPLYVITILGTAVAVSFFTTLPAREYFTHPDLFKYLAANLPFLNFLHDSLPGFLSGEAVNGALWTLKIEWAFYFLLPLLILLEKKISGNGEVKQLVGSREMQPSATGSEVQQSAGFNQKRRAVYLAILFLIAAVLTALTRILTNRYGLPEGINYQIQRGMLFFSCGMFWYTFRDKKLPGAGRLPDSSDAKPSLEIIWTLLALIISIFCIWKWGLWAQILLAPMLTILVRAFATKARFFFFYPRSKDISYPIYLIHLPIIQMVRSTGLVQTNPIMGVVLIWVLTLGIAILLHLLDGKKTQNR